MFIGRTLVLSCLAVILEGEGWLECEQVSANYSLYEEHCYAGYNSLFYFLGDWLPAHKYAAIYCI